MAEDNSDDLSLMQAADLCLPHNGTVLAEETDRI